jgi:hypothetical protein
MTHLGVTPDRNGQVIAVERLRFGAIVFVACMGREVARRKASVTEITGTARERTRRPKRRE